MNAHFRHEEPDEEDKRQVWKAVRRNDDSGSSDSEDDSGSSDSEDSTSGASSESDIEDEDGDKRTQL